MATLADLSYQDDFAAAKKPLLTDLRASLDSFETYINNSLKDNLVAFVNDAFGTSYAFDSDGLQQFADWTLFDKQTDGVAYTGGDKTISTTGAWTDLDASNCQITFTPELLTGDFKLSFDFMVNLLTTNATNEADISFRMDIAGAASVSKPKVRYVSGVSGSRLCVPVHFSHIQTCTGESSVTIKLQYFITTQTACTIQVLANSTNPFIGTVEKV